jgi:hypothetical protein
MSICVAIVDSRRFGMTDSEHILRLVSEGRYSISRRHIEQQRPWRGILVVHVRHALRTAEVVSYEEDAAILRGADVDGRILEMPVKPILSSFRACGFWREAELVHVLTAYIPDGKTNDTIRQVIYRLRLIFLGGRT